MPRLRRFQRGQIGDKWTAWCRSFPYTELVRRALTLSKAVEAKVQRLARRIGRTPRQILRAAVDEYVARHDHEAMTAAANRVAATVDTHPDPAHAAAAAAILRNTEW